MSSLDLTSILELTVQTALRAGELLQGFQGTLVSADVSSKSSSVDLVSIADHASEDLLREELRRIVPEAAFIGEESHHKYTRGQEQYLWVVDPLDGTSNFLAGLPVWSISIALCQPDLTPLLGLVCAPLLGRTWTALSGGGAWLDGERLRVRAVPPGAGLENAMLATGFPYDVHIGTTGTNIDNFVKMQRHFQKIRRFGSAAIDLAYVAEGVFDGFWELRLREWDTAAGILLVTEAGGLCQRIDGSPYVPGAPDLLATATPELMALVRSILAST